MLVEPGADSGAELIVSGDQIHAESEFSCWGLSVPQSSVDPVVVNVAVNKVADECRARGIVGYVTVDFVTFIDPVSVSVAVCLSVCPSVSRTVMTANDIFVNFCTFK